jgi:23S rRNA (pseudouridine1915-N3)-methyltransferase
VKWELVSLQTKTPSWLAQIEKEYEAKLRPHVQFKKVLYQSPKRSRENAELRKQEENDIFLKNWDPSACSIVFDERGSSMSSIEFSKYIGDQALAGKSKFRFLIGGPYGFNAEVRNSASKVIKLSDMVFNHLVAEIVLLEQLYRAVAIQKNLPYHNE